MGIYSEIKKYLLYLICFFCLLITGHLVLLYIYSDATKYPLPGGNLQVGIVGNQPTLNIFEFDPKIDNSSHDAIFRLVQRGLVRYSLTEKRIVNDLASCTTDSFPLVRCTLNQHALWNDGTSMNTQDILSTYAFLKKNSKNSPLAEQLAWLEISEETGDILFRFKTNNISAIQLLFVPIFRTQDLIEGWDGRLSGLQSMSWPYTYVDSLTDKNIITLKRNNYYKQSIQPFYYDQIDFWFALTLKELKKKIRADIILLDTPVSEKNFKQHAYTESDIYLWSLNTLTLPLSFRRVLWQEIMASIDTNDMTVKHIDNIFLGDIPNTLPPVDWNQYFETIFSLWYSFGWKFEAPQIAPKPQWTLLKYIKQPTSLSPHFTSESYFEIQGTPPPGTTKIIINDFILKKFNPKKKTYSYSVKPDFLNLTIWENIYRVSFYADTKLLAEESLTVYYNTDATLLAKEKTLWEEKNTPAPETPVNNDTLDPKKLYNRQWKLLKIRILVQSDSPFLETIWDRLSLKLQEYSTEVELKKMTWEEIRKIAMEQPNSYDIILSTVNLWLLYYDVSSIFHSVRSKNQNNFSWIKKPELDALLSKLTEKLYYNSPDKLRILESNIQKIIEKEEIIKTLGSPLRYINIKPTIQNISIPEFIVGNELLSDILARSYFKIWYKISDGEKSIFWFLSWLKNELFSSQ